MANKFIGIILIVLVGFLLVFFAYSTDDSGDVDLDVSSEGPVKLSQVIDDIETSPVYEGYDNETLNWMKSLGDKYVFYGDGIIVIMSRSDADKLHSVYVTDAYITEYIKCNVLENHSLGNIKYPRDVLLVNKVSYQGETLTDLQGSV